MSENVTGTTTTRTDVWESWGWVWSAIFYLALIVSTGLALMDGDLTSSNLVVVALLVLASAVWHFLGAIVYVRRYPDFRSHPVIMAFYLVVAFALWWLLLGISQEFYFLLFGLFGQIFAFLALRWAIPASIAGTALIAYEQNGVDISLLDPTIWLFAALALSGILIALWLTAIISQSAQRRELIEELQATRDELAQAERAAGVLAERQRLAGEIHDTLAQGFTSIVMHLEAAEQALPPDAVATQQHLDQARRVARESLAEARGLVWSLSSEKLQRATLPQAIDRVVHQWSDSTGLPAEFILTGECVALHPQAEVTLLRAVQEGLANVQKHAAADKVSVTLSYIGDVVMLDVQDDGAGFDEADLDHGRPRLHSGYGLPAMRERAAQLGGQLTIESTPGEGTTLVLELPI